MVIVLDGHQAKGLQHAVSQPLYRAQDLGHAMHGAGLCLKGHFDKVARTQRLLEAQQASGDGDGLEFGFRAAAIFETNRSQNGISKLDPGGAPRRMRLGEVRHRPHALSHYAITRNRLRRPLVRIPRGKRKFDCSNLQTGRTYLMLTFW